MTGFVKIFETSSLDSEDLFIKNLYPLRCPVVLRGVDVGPAILKWKPDYLATCIGSMPVKVHVSASSQMDFQKKNFVYRTLSFDEFMRRVPKEKQEEFFLCPEEKYYLRSLGDDPRKDVADIQEQFPCISGDLTMPLYFQPRQFFSSVFRISSKGMQLWTHYDVMDNFLVHISGRKRVILFPPNEALNLYLSGDKSLVIDIDNPDLDKFPNFRYAKKLECTLEPGDILFIPALWFHNVTALDYSVSVNIFWKNLEERMYDSKDMYGNKDPVPALRAMQGVDKALKALEELPEEYKDFYSRRLVSKILESLDTHISPSGSVENM